MRRKKNEWKESIKEIFVIYTVRYRQKKKKKRQKQSKSRTITKFVWLMCDGRLIRFINLFIWFCLFFLSWYFAFYCALKIYVRMFFGRCACAQCCYALTKIKEIATFFFIPTWTSPENSVCVLKQLLLFSLLVNTYIYARIKQFLEYR